jgi:hypothetical protein
MRLQDSGDNAIESSSSERNTSLGISLLAWLHVSTSGECIGRVGRLCLIETSATTCSSVVYEINELGLNKML